MNRNEKLIGIAEILARISNVGPAALSPLFLNVLLGWSIEITKQAEYRWQSCLGRQVPCGFGGCPNDAISLCKGCGRPTCLEHNLVSMNAETICKACFSFAVENATPWQPLHKEKATSIPNDLLMEDYAILGLTSTCSDAELMRARREFLSTYHPDKAVKEKHKKLNQNIFVRGQMAYERIAKTRGIQ